MRILFTGLNGLVGSYLATLLHNSSLLKNDNVTSFCRSSSSLSGLLPGLIVDDVVTGDCNSVTDWINVLGKSRPEIIIHIAQLRYVPQMLQALDAFTDINPYIICVGSTGRFSRFKSCAAPYLNSEHLLESSTYKYLVLRPSMIYGHFNDRNVHRLYERISRGRFVFLPNNGSSLFQPVFYQDVSYAVFSSLQRALLSRSSLRVGMYNIPGPSTVSLLTLVQLIEFYLSVKILKISVPITPLFFLIKVLERLKINFLPITSEQVLRLREDKVFENHWNLLCPEYTPKTIAQGLTELGKSYI